MPSKRHRNRESSVTGNAIPTEDIRAHMNSETQKKMLNEEENPTAPVSENVREESEPEDLDANVHAARSAPKSETAADVTN